MAGKNFILSPVVLTNEAKLILKTRGLEKLQAKFFKVNETKMAEEQSEFGENSPDIQSVFGQPLFDTFQFLATQFDDLDGKRINIAAPIVLESVLIEVNQTKKVVITEVQGANGNIKEFINPGDYEISLTGMIVGKNANQPPDLNLRNALEKLLNAPVALPVTSNFMDFLKINSVVVMEFRFNQIEGTRNAIGISVTMLSDVAYEIKYKEAQQAGRTFSTFTSVV